MDVQRTAEKLVRGTHSRCLFKKIQNVINEKMRIEQRKFHADVGGVVVVSLLGWVLNS